jgi:hypothetical protein
MEKTSKLIFDEVLAKIKKNKEVREKNGFTCIPLGLPRFEQILPGIIQGLYYIVTASSGVGKTQITKHLFVNSPFKFYKENKNPKFKLKIFYFALEESKQAFILSMISNYIFEKYGKQYSPLELESYLKGVNISNEIVNMIEDARDYFKDFEEIVTIIDHIYNPTGIFKYMETYAEQNGTFHRGHEKVIYRDKNGEKKEELKNIITGYTPNNPDEYVIVITDHISLLHPEQKEDLHQTMGKFSSEYCLKMVKRFNYTVINVQQQAASQEGIENIKLSKLEPSLNGLADNKLTQRDADVVLGLFAPNRHDLKTHAKYDIEKLRDNYRSLNILKFRQGVSNVRIGLYFRGESNYFEELPKSNDLEKLEKYYN